MRERRQIVIGTRASPLAVAQAQIVASALKSSNASLKISVKKIRTEGDYRRKKEPSATTGKDLFTRRIDEALEEATIDIAVHSLKDVPVEFAKSNTIEIAAYPKREDPSDVLIPRRAEDTLTTLPRNGRVGTSSVRRSIQLRSFRPDLEIIEIHGNVETRIKKLQQSSLDAIILAAAGLNRLQIHGLGSPIPHEIMLPAVGQGCLAIAVRIDDESVKKLVKSIDDKETRLAVSAERAFSKYLDGGCNTPVAALATIQAGKIVLEGLVERNDGKSSIIRRGKVTGSITDPDRLGKALGKRLLKDS